MIICEQQQQQQQQQQQRQQIYILPLCEYKYVIKLKYILNGNKNMYNLEHSIYNIEIINVRRTVMWRNSPTRNSAASFLRFLDHTHTHTHTHTYAR
jgi:hypothetical protein